LHGLYSLLYKSRLQCLNLQSLVHRRLLTDLVWCYKIVFGLVVVNTNDLFELSAVTQTRGHRYKLFKKSISRNIRTTFSASVSSVCGTIKLPADMDFSSLGKFKRTITLMDFSDYLQCFSSNFSFAFKHILLYSAFVILCFYVTYVYHVALM